MASYSLALETKYDLAAWWMSENGRKIVAKTADTWVPPLPHDMSAEMSRSVQASLAQRLVRGETYFVTERIGRFLDATIGSFPDVALRREDLPSRYGWVYFERPLSIPGYPGEEADSRGYRWDQIKAISWNSEWATRKAVEARGGTWASSGDSILMLNVDSYAPTNAGGWGKPHLSYALQWPMGENWGSDWVATDRQAVADGRDDLSVQTTYLRRALLCFYTFVGQRVFVTRDEQADRFARKRIAQAFPGEEERTIRVVSLRREVDQTPRARPDEPSEWSCHWMVRGHFRIVTDKEGRERPIWVTPYVKGNLAMPFKPPAELVFRVQR